MSHTAAPKVAFIFDCDGTLVNSTPVWAYAQPESVSYTHLTLPTNSLV